MIPTQESGGFISFSAGQCCHPEVPAATGIGEENVMIAPRTLRTLETRFAAPEGSVGKRLYQQDLHLSLDPSLPPTYLDLDLSIKNMRVAISVESSTAGMPRWRLLGCIGLQAAGDPPSASSQPHLLHETISSLVRPRLGPVHEVKHDEGVGQQSRLIWTLLYPGLCCKSHPYPYTWDAFSALIGVA